MFKLQWEHISECILPKRGKNRERSTSQFCGNQTRITHCFFSLRLEHVTYVLRAHNLPARYRFYVVEEGEEGRMGRLYEHERNVGVQVVFVQTKSNSTRIEISTGIASGWREGCFPPTSLKRHWHWWVAGSYSRNARTFGHQLFVSTTETSTYIAGVPVNILNYRYSKV